MILSIEGAESTGKSTLALTAPLPIVMFSLDMGSERAIYGTKYVEHFEGLSIVTHPYPKIPKGGKVTPASYKDNDITVYRLQPPLQLDETKLVGYIELWNYFISIFNEAIMDDSVGTIVVDTMTLLRKAKADAYLQELQEGGKARKQLQQIEYGHPDGAIRTLYQYAAAVSKNFVAVHHVRPHYSNQVNRDGQIESMPDGTDEIDGVRDTLRYVDVALKNTKDKGKLTSTVVKCGPNLGYEGVPLADCTWDKLIDMLEMGWHGTPFSRRKPHVEQAAEKTSA